MSTNDQILYDGKFLRVLRRGDWEFVSRRNVTGIVGIIAVTSDGKLLLVEQYRPPLAKNVIEIPAGLAGDVAGSEHEALEAAARRELLEETGYEAQHLHEVAQGASSAGLCDEMITLFVAHNLMRKHENARGDGSENITLHEIPLDQVQSWIAQRIAQGAQVDLKVYAALHFAQLKLAQNHTSHQT
jgi:ADP-ribose pyrophosphatase